MPGDIFPMPIPQVGLPPSECDFRHRKLYQRVRARWFRLCRAKHTIEVLNECAGARASPCSFRQGSAHLRSSGAANPCQQSVEDRVLRRVAAHGPAPPGTNLEAVYELLKTDNLDLPRPSTVAAFEWDRLRLLSPDWPVRPRDITTSAPEHVRSVFLDPELIRLSDEEFSYIHADERLIRPYCDATFRSDRQLRLRFFKALADRGLLSFRLRVRSLVGIFFVRKKNGDLRMVIDARQTNQSHRLPPHVPLGSARAWSMLDLGLGPGEEEDAEADSEDGASGPSLWCGSGDLCDGFYQFKNEDFGVDF